MKSKSEKRADQLAVFRLPTALLRSADMFCAEQDMTRSQLFRRCIAEYLEQQHGRLSGPASSTRKEYRLPLRQKG